MPHGNRILDPFLASISPVRTNTATILHSRIRKSVVVSGDATTNLAKMELRPPLLGIFPLPFGSYRTHPALLPNFSCPDTIPTSTPKSIEIRSRTVHSKILYCPTAGSSKKPLKGQLAGSGTPFLDGKKCVFWKKSVKSDHGILPGGKGAKSQSCRCFVFFRRPIRRMDEAPFSCFWTDSKSYFEEVQASRPCRARCI